MPITFSHPGIIFPFKHYFPKLSLLALIIGSVIPDVEHFIQLSVAAKIAHTWWGMFVFNLPMGVLYYYLAKVIVLPVLLNVSPIKFRNDVLRTYNFKVICFSILIGSFSHLFLDGFTSKGGFFVKLFPVLREQVQFFSETRPDYLYITLWYVFSWLGSLIVVILFLKQVDLSKTIDAFTHKKWHLLYFIEALFFAECIVIAKGSFFAFPDQFMHWSILIVGACMFACIITSLHWKYLILTDTRH
ncbi:DUF4184 family protein [Flammeovirga kamogawensis]|uniref:DUF4184 family protein n=1 Tax=Flammeovirga kamogawensis TaxID=373891 RepID=A0ABX8GY10_9BACT|nr:DUF4184 family protein [Flammeovirga kamogawensis]MBB6460729.1 hypothetical protein [Flammeovirga kamogawensis]QWG08082.1 DUF4184 family protein [Flammeovirga kamogawensis]TRX69885.1 DUF4184 family protein [Flammeovirga kamogawensis]